MTVGEGIFWAGWFYLTTRVLEIAYAWLIVRFPRTQVQRLDRIEKVLREIEGV